MNDEITLQQENIGSLQNEWNVLLRMTPTSSLFLTWEWMSGWCRHLVRPHEQPFIITARQNGHLLGIAPLMRSYNKNETQEIGFIGQDYSYRLGLIVEPTKTEKVYPALVQYLYDLFNHENCSGNFQHLIHDPHLMNAVQALAAPSGLVISRGYLNPGCAVPMRGSFDDYLKTGIRSGKLRSYVSNRLRMLESVAKVDFYLSPPAKMGSFFRELLTFHRETMKLRSKDSILTGEEFPGHLSSFIQNWPDPASIRLCNVNLNGMPAVRLLGVVYRSIFFALTIGIDPTVRAQFPGFNMPVLSQAYCIKLAIREGCTHYDFLGGSLPYKKKMGGNEHSGITLEIRKHTGNSTLPGRSVALVTHAFLRPADLEGLTLGGVEVWTLSLADLLIHQGITPVIFQGDPKGFRRFYHGTEVSGISGKSRHEINRRIHEEIKKRAIPFIIYTSSFIGEKYFVPGNLFVQHGIHWDYPTGHMGLSDRIKWEWIRRKLARHDLKMARASKMTIAVDTHFINYYRTAVPDPAWSARIRYIPNFCIPQDKHLWQQKWQNPTVIHLAFTRRFELRRGVTVMAEAAELLLQSVSDLKITFAGSGLYKPWLEEKFRGEHRVNIAELSHQETYSLLNTVHIAVIPSTYSEGTSLACLEAMACGCAVVSTTTGGLGNIVIPGFNGLIARSEAGDLASIAKDLIANPGKTNRIAMNGYRMVQEAFSLSIWQTRIKQALTDAGIL